MRSAARSVPGHEHACWPARRDGESNTVIGRNRGSAANGRQCEKRKLQVLVRIASQHINLLYTELSIPWHRL
jgi:uncharacterized protein (UPF0248 family)